MLLKQLLASLLRVIFKIKVLRPHYYGLHERIIKPFRLFHGISRTVALTPELRVVLDIEDWIPQQLYLLGEYEGKELRFVTKNLKRGDLFVDIGANFGLYSLVASGIIGKEGTIYAFEPYPDNYQQLLQNIAANRINNIIAEKLAISSSQSSIHLKTTNLSLNSGMISEFCDGPGPVHSVAATSLDSYGKGRFTRPVSLIKIDIEGGEHNSLLGMHRILTEDRPLIIMELDESLLEKAGSSVQSIELLLGRYKYSKRYIKDDGSLSEQKITKDQSRNCVFVPL